MLEKYAYIEIEHAWSVKKKQGKIIWKQTSWNQQLEIEQMILSHNNNLEIESTCHNSYLIS